MKLKNTPLGFMTDERKASGNKPAVFYDVARVKEFSVETIANGFTLTGNEVNMIASRMYAAKAGVSRKLKDQKGFSALRLELGIPTGQKDGSIVHFDATWKIGDNDQSLSGEIPIRVNNYMGIDAILGKAERKAKYRILNQVVGSDLGFVDGDIHDAEEVNITDVKSDDFAPGRSEINPKTSDVPPEQPAEKSEPATEPENPAQEQPKTDDTVIMADEKQLAAIQEHLKAMKVADPEMMLSVVNDALRLGGFQPVESRAGLTDVTAAFVIKQLMPREKKTTEPAGPAKAGLF